MKVTLELEVGEFVISSLTTGSTGFHDFILVTNLGNIWRWHESAKEFKLVNFKG